jgi:hypothetical protein
MLLLTSLLPAYMLLAHKELGSFGIKQVFGYTFVSSEVKKGTVFGNRATDMYSLEIERKPDLLIRQKEILKKQ